MEDVFDPSDSGIFNQLLSYLGLGPSGWLSSQRTAMISILIPLGWSTMGPGCLIYLAALKTVPDDLYEAAAIDGGGFFARLSCYASYNKTITDDSVNICINWSLFNLQTMF